MATIFPYTTLFRSHQGAEDGWRGRHPRPASASARRKPRRRRSASARRRHRALAGSHGRRAVAAMAGPKASLLIGQTAAKVDDHRGGRSPYPLTVPIGLDVMAIASLTF